VSRIDHCTIKSSARATWADDPSLYQDVRAHVERGAVVVLGKSLHAGALPIGVDGSWSARVWDAFARGIRRLRQDGLSPRFACWFRADVLRGEDNGADGAIDPDLPPEVVLTPADWLDQARRVGQAASEIGDGQPPGLSSHLGNWDTQEGPLFDLARARGGPLVVYCGNHSRERYTSAIWQIRAILLDPDAAAYHAWLAEAARRNVRRILEIHPVLEGLELEIHSKDKHYHTDEAGDFLWPPITSFNADGRSSGLSTFPEPYRHVPNWARRALQERALRSAGVACYSRFWIDSQLRPQYVDALGPGREWTT